MKPSGEGGPDSTDKEDSRFQSETSRSTLNRIGKTARGILNRTIEAAEDVAHRGRLELEIASLKMRLRGLYAQIGETIYRLREGEERSDPIADPAIQELFTQVRAGLKELASMRHSLDKLREREHRITYGTGA